MSRVYYLAQYGHLEFMHGGISYVDIETIFRREGWIPITLTGDADKGFFSKLKRIAHFVRWLSAVKRDDTVIFLFPVYARLYRLLSRALVYRGARVVPLIGDLDGVRDGNAVLDKAEAAFLAQFPTMIVQTPMLWLLKERLPEVKAIEFPCFDYLAPPAANHRALSGDVVFAGNLAKSKFLLHLGQLVASDMRFVLYGPDLPETVERFPNCLYRGVVNPHDLPGMIEGSFGLVWDGDSINGLEGSDGLYNRFNITHKFSLYVLSGLPVIAHSGSGAARLIEEYQIGFTVDSLAMIPEKIKALPKESYELMRSNMKGLALRISEGYHMKDVLRKIANQNSSFFM